MSSNNLFSPQTAYREEQKQLLIERKNDLLSKIKDIQDDLETKDLNEFLNQGSDEKELSESQIIKAKNLGNFKLFCTIKIFGILLFTTHLISIYEINEIINAIEEELMASSISFIRQRDREPTDDFYQNFNKINNIFPDYSLFFISSFLSESLNQIFGYIFLTIIILIINLCILFLGFKNYEFNINRNNYINYNLKQFIHLYIIYLILSICQGFIALIPLQIIKEGFIFYEKFKSKMKNKFDNDDENIQNQDKERDVDIVNNRENNIRNKYSKSPKFYYQFEGYILFFVISIFLSVTVKTILDQIFIGKFNYNSKHNVNRFIICYFISMMISLFFYILFKHFQINDEAKEKKKKKFFSSELFGYIIYSNSIQSEDFSCHLCNSPCESCEDCKICCQTLNLSLCLYFCSCKCCWKGIFSCCNCCSCNNYKNDKYKIRSIKDINKVETICILYRITGKWNWLGYILTEPRSCAFIIILYSILITNMGFEDRIWNNLENNNGGGKNIYLINGITLISILLYYLINKFGGKCLMKIFHAKKEDLLIEGYIIIVGLFPYILLQTIFSTIVSGLIYYRKINNIENYILSITKGSVEYSKINVLEYFAYIIEMNHRNLVFFSSSTIISFYLLIFRIILYILNLLDVDNISIMHFQFIIGIIFCSILLLCFFWVAFAIKNEEKKNSKYEESRKRQQIKIYNNESESITERKNN